MAGASSGRVIRVSVASRPAPSTCEASNTSRGNACRRANTMTITNGVHCHESTRTSVHSATAGSPSQSGSGSPSSASVQLMIPQSGLSRARHISPTTIGVSSIGRTSMPRTNHEPRRCRLKNRARAVPMTTWMATPSPVSRAVLTVACQNTGSAAMFAKLSSPMNENELAIWSHWKNEMVRL